MTKNINITNFFSTVKTLRGNTGCPWDQKQSPETLKKYLCEEFSELLDAIDSADHCNIQEESGDLLFLLVLLAEIHNEKNLFSFNDVIKGINEKMIRRHPHVFAGSPMKDELQLEQQWQEIKQLEKKKK